MSQSVATSLLPPLAEWADDDIVRRQFRLFSDGTMQGVLDLIDVSILILNTNRQAVFVNKRLRDLLTDQSLECIIGRRPGDIFGCLHALETSGGCGTSESCAMCGARESILMGLSGCEASKECRILSTSSGRLAAHDLLVTSKPLNKQGDRFAIVTLQDISHQKRRRTLERIFFHDMLNTAGSLNGIAELVADRGPEAIGEELDLFKLTSMQIVEEIQAQKLLMDAECRELKVRLCELRSGRVLHDLCLAASKQKAARNRSLIIDSNMADIAFNSDPTLLKRVLGNMIKNALEAVDEGETVTVTCEENDGGPLFKVTNPGVIGKQARMQIFMRHFSTKGAGRGLGTYSIKLLGEDYLKGKVWFESTPANGTTFFLALPAGATQNI